MGRPLGGSVFRRTSTVVSRAPGAGLVASLREKLEKTDWKSIADLRRMYSEACRKVERCERSGDVEGLVDAKYEKNAVGRRLGEIRKELIAYARRPDLAPRSTKK